jgi:hypothetical protein
MLLRIGNRFGAKKYLWKPPEAVLTIGHGGSLML